MPEILTESFCERCGTRYTFESAAPKARLGRFKTLSKGLKNFVLDDATSLDDALASARSDESRESTAQQLDAFHKTFNFCMSCRQYTCPNCWNEAEGQCQSCSPIGLSPAWSRGDASAPPAWPTAPAEPAGIEAMAWPSTDRRPAAPEPTPDEVPWPLAALEGRVPVVGPEADAEPEPAIAAEAEPEPEPRVEEMPVAAAESEPAAEPDDLQTAIQNRAAAAAANTSDLLARFRPGQSIDDELAAYEASLDAAPAPVVAAEPEPEPVAWAEPEPKPVEWPAAEPAPVPWPDAEPEPEPVAASEPAPEPEPVAEPEAEPEPVVWAQPEPDQPEDEPVRPWTRPTRPAQDIVEVPTWQFTAPETPVNGHPSDALSPAARADRPTPEWPSQPAESFLAARLAARKAGDDMWAASSAEVLGPAAAAAGPAAPAGVQACVSCGLSLSATARFCRRCGTRQG